jgi:hypothetical protein
VLELQSTTYRISLNKKIAEVGLTHEPCPFRQNHVIIHSSYGEEVTCVRSDVTLR